MSAQKTKKVSCPWTQCDKCAIILSPKDCDAHVDDCPPVLNNFNYDFIKDNILYGTLDFKTNENVKNLSSTQVDNLVFLSQTAIQICSLTIGLWAVIESIDESVPPVIKKVWPTLEKTLTSVLLNKNGLELSPFRPNQTVKISAAPKNICPAERITIILLNGPKSLELSPELYSRISKSHEGRILTSGNKIALTFYGKMLKFEVKTIKPHKNYSNNLETTFSKLCIGDKYELFAVDEHTNWKLYRDEDTFNEEKIQKDLISVLGGVESEIQEIRELIHICLGNTKLPLLIQTHAILLYGNSGTGKTLIAKALAQELEANVVMMSSPDLYSKNVNNSVEETIAELFEEAIHRAPSIIILDEFDILCPSRSSSRLTEVEKKIVSTMLLLMDTLNNRLNSKVFIIATTNKPDNIDPAFRRCGRLDREIEIPVPSPIARRDILTKILRDVPTSLSENELTEVAVITHGFVGSDLVTLCSTASINATKRRESSIQLEDFKKALKKVRPSAMREVQIEVPNVKWSDIGGQDNLKLILKQAVEWPLKHSASFQRLGITPPKGVLMFGPPGCSKTMIAKALATESGLNFLSIKGPELFSKWVGESERAVREVFRKARQVAPSVIFFDEIDALGGERSSGSSTSVQERVLAQLLTELDGVTPLGDVTILAATNRPDRIDKALLRPGRLDRIVYVPLPDENTRRDIFRIKFSKMPILNVDIEDLVKNTDHYSGAEVNAVCHEAAMMALEENLEIQHVEKRHFDKALKLVTPRTPSSLIKLYEDYLQIKI